MSYENRALWLLRRGAKLQVGPARYAPPGVNEVSVRVRAVAVNPVDAIPLMRASGLVYRLLMPWLTFPTVLGGDLAGEVVQVGENVTRFKPGDRVLGLALGLERSQNRAAEGAFQHYAVLMQHMVSPIPDSLSYERASVLPMTLATAATGLYQQDHLALPLPTLDPPDRDATIFIWGGSSSVGSNAIQLARASGYKVITTCSPHNFDYVHSLGAGAAIDCHSRTAVDEIVAAIGPGPLAGTVAVTRGSVRATAEVAARALGAARVTAAQPALASRLQMLRSPHKHVAISAIWGGTLKDNEVGPGIFADFLPAALVTGRYRAAPQAVIVGKGLDTIPTALTQLKQGVSAKKLVVQLP